MIHDPPVDIADLRRELGTDFEIRTCAAAFTPRVLERGWLLRYLIDFDDLTWHRWSYWYRLQTHDHDTPAADRRLPAEPIPPIEFSEAPWEDGKRVTGEPGPKRVCQMIRASFDAIDPYQRHWDYLLDWLLFGFGNAAELPPEPTAGASMRLYQVFNVGAMLLYPSDYFGAMLNAAGHGERSGFFVTPFSLVETIVAMTFSSGEDARALTVMDPCMGTGRFGLVASNYSLRLYGVDIDGLALKAALVNAYLYAPWMARPIAWLDAAYPHVDDIAEPDTAAGVAHRDFLDLAPAIVTPRAPRAARVKTPAITLPTAEQRRLFS